MRSKGLVSVASFSASHTQTRTHRCEVCALYMFVCQSFISALKEGKKSITSVTLRLWHWLHSKELSWTAGPLSPLICHCHSILDPQEGKLLIWWCNSFTRLRSVVATYFEKELTSFCIMIWNIFTPKFINVLFNPISSHFYDQHRHAKFTCLGKHNQQTMSL